MSQPHTHTWADGPGGGTPITAAKLTDIEGDIAAALADQLIPTATKYAAYTAVYRDLVIVDATNGPVTITAPADMAGKFFGVKKVDTTANIVTVQAAGSDTIGAQGGTSVPLKVQDQSRIFAGSAGGNWASEAGMESLAALDLRYLNSPVFTGVPSASTPSAGTNTTQLATTAFVKYAISVLPNKTFYALPPVNDIATDTASINAAISAANAQGGVVQLQWGTYFISSALTALANGVELRGHGPIATVIRTFSTTSDIVTSSNSSCVGVRDIQLEGALTVTRTAGAGINFSGVTGYVIDNVRWIDTFNVATFDTCNSGWLSRLKVAYGGGTAWNRGFWWQSCVDTHVSQVLINGGTTVLAANKAWMQIDSGCDTWAGVDLSMGCSSGSGLVLWFSHALAPGSFAPRWVKVTNFWVEGSSGVAGAGSNGVQIDAGTSLYFDNGYSVTGYNGISATSGSDLRFSKCFVANNWLRGALFGGAIADLTVTDCNFDSNSQGATGNVGHLYLAGSITSPRIRDCVFSNDLLTRSNKPNYAIENNLVQGNNLLVSGCRFKPAAYTSGIIGGSGGTAMKLRDNDGYNPVGNFTAPTMPASGTPVTNSYGVDCQVYVTGGTVTAIAINGTTVGITAGMVRLSPGQTITFTYSAAPTWKWFGE